MEIGKGLTEKGQDSKIGNSSSGKDWAKKRQKRKGRQRKTWKIK